MIIGIGVLVLIIWYIVANIAYKKTDYYSVTRKKYASVLFNKGNYGEFLTYKYLRGYEAEDAKFLFNCYLPKDDGETTEIDVLMIHSSGIYVFESKNYSEVSSTDIYVLKRDMLKKTVGQIAARTGKMLSREQMDEIYQKLYPYTQVSETVKEQHIQRIQMKKTDDLLCCPRCGGRLVLKEAKKGTHAGGLFYGCSNFPKCRYTRNV
jgi:DNA-directed RNA polymerase subunit RPC12/RpoP